MKLPHSQPNHGSEPQYTKPDLTMFGESHVAAYRDTGGDLGYLWNGVPTLLLTVVGRRSGREVTSALIFGRDGDDYIVVASQGGAPTHPLWYLNLQANPRAEIQVRAERIAVVARTASSTERSRLWSTMVAVWPNYDVYRHRTVRDIPVVVLSRI